MKFIFSLFLIVGTSAIILAQENTAKQQHIDSLTAKLKADSTYIYRFKTLRLYANIELSNAYVGTNFLNLAAFKLGVVVNQYHTFGVGYYTLNTFSLLKSNEVKKNQFDKINFGTLFYEYLLLDRKHFDIVLPFEGGYGNYTVKPLTDSTGAVTHSDMALLGFGVKLMIMPHKWIGLKIGGGYRYIWEGNTHIGLTGAYFTLGIRLDIDLASRDIKYLRKNKKYRRAVSKL